MSSGATSGLTGGLELMETTESAINSGFRFLSKSAALVGVKMPAAFSWLDEVCGAKMFILEPNCIKAAMVKPEGVFSLLAIIRKY